MEEKKELKDYLHLYIGCEIEVDGTVWNSTKHICKLTGIEIKPSVTFYGCTNNFGTQWYHTDIITPILRPLSDMSEAEAKEFIIDVLRMKDHFGWKPFNYKIQNGFLSIESSLHAKPRNSNDKFPDHYVIIKNWGEDGMGEWIFNCSYSMNDVVWLLKRGFDIFGLISEGLAIDKTQIQPPTT